MPREACPRECAKPLPTCNSHFIAYLPNQQRERTRQRPAGGPPYSIASRIPPGRFIWVVCVVGCWVVVFASGCMFVRSWALLAHILEDCPGSLSGSILGARRVAWAPFWRLWVPLGIHFGGLGAPLGFIFGALGLLWRIWGSLGAPLAAQGAQSQIFPLFSLSFWAHVGSILEVKIDKKSDVIFS